ncbi:MAG TPA: hypothetical protein VJ246_04190 [Patescibacteria group bacterium]|nr:hypothetical protein [Patescibacteria group bacterium]
MEQKKTKRETIIWVGVLALIIIIFLGILLALWRGKAPEVPQEAGVVSDLEKPGGIKTVLFSLTFTEPPSTLPIFQVQSVNQDPSVFAEQIAQKLSMLPATQEYLKDTWFSLDQTSSLTVAVKGSILFLADIERKPPSQVNVDSSMEAATSFLSRFISLDKLTLDASKITYTSATGEDEGSTSRDVAVIPFTYNLNNFPLFINDSLKEFARVWVNSHNDIIKAEFFIPPEIIQTSEVAQMPDKASIEKDILERKAEVLSTFFLEDSVLINEVTTVEIGSAQIQYRYAPLSSRVLPYLQLDALGKSADGRSLAIRFLIRASAE